MRQLFSKLLIFIRPFKENLGLFLIVLYCSTAAILLFDFIYKCPSTVYIAKIGFIISYLSVFVVGLFKGKPFKIAENILLVLAFVNLAMDVIVEMTSGVRFNDSVCDLICQTNMSESQEYVRSYITPKVILTTLALLAAPVPFVFLWKHIKHIPETIAPYILTPALLYCLFFTDIITSVSPSVFLFKTHYLTHGTEYIDLSQYAHEPVLEMADINGAQNVVIIIGESMSKSHCSLYSYPIETYPSLKALDPIVFQNVCSPGRATNSSFKGILNTHRIADDSEDWFSSTTIFDLAKALSMKTSWVSNQMRYGLTGNIVSDYAALADSSKWVVEIDNYSSTVAKHLDEEILPELFEFQEGKNMAIIHLMGSDEEFSARFPSSFEKFKPEDYEYLPSHQRQKVADYDNSLLYNDYVVSEIINKYSGDDVVFFYFPDHGLDIFESNDSFCGHGLISDPESWRIAVITPFLAFYSERFAEVHPELILMLQEKAAQPFCTDTFIYLLAETLGVKTLDGINTSDGLK